MRLKRIVIKNFRSIKKADIYIGDICAIVGENNSGKSSILRALNSFFNYEQEETYFLNANHQHTQRSQPIIELTFNEMPDDVTEFAAKVDRGELVVHATYISRSRKMNFSYKREGKYHGVDPSFIFELKKFISFVFIPANRDTATLKTQENTLLKDVLHAYLEKATIHRDNYSVRVKNATKYLQEQALNKVSKEIGRFYSLSRSFDYNVKYVEGVNYSILLRDIEIFIADSGRDFNIEDCGSGLQSLTVIALHRYLASLKHNKVIIGLEEPETNLHPQSQRELIKSTRSSSAYRNESQIIFTTHSSTIADQLDHREIVLCLKQDDQNRGFVTIIMQLPLNFWEKHDIQEFQYRRFYQYRNSDFFFARKIILTESKTDAEVVRRLLDDQKIDLDVNGVSLINLEGIGNLKYPYFLAKELQIPIFIILDKDYFLPYLNGELDKSRDSHGFPKYRYEFKKTCLVRDFVGSHAEATMLLNLLKKNHSKALNLLVRYNVICFNYSLEIDLISSKDGARLYYERLKVGQASRNSRELLVNRKNQIKDVQHLLHVASSLPTKNLPNSYKRIKKALPKFIIGHSG